MKKQETHLFYFPGFQLRRQRNPQLILHGPALLPRIGNYWYIHFRDQTQFVRVFIYLNCPLYLCLLGDLTEDVWWGFRDVGCSPSCPQRLSAPVTGKALSQLPVNWREAVEAGKAELRHWDVGNTLMCTWQRENWRGKHLAGKKPSAQWKIRLLLQGLSFKNQCHYGLGCCLP